MNIEKTNNCHHSTLTSPDILRAEETALLLSKTLENSTYPDLPPLSDYIRVYKNACIRKANNSISKTNSSDDVILQNTHIGATLGEKSGKSGQSGQTKKTDSEILATVISKYPDLQDPEHRRFVALLLQIEGRRFTLSEIEKLEFEWRKNGLSIWKYVRGELPAEKSPRGMVGQGVFLAGCSGNAILPEYSGGERI